MIAINLSDLEAETRCPVCLGILLHSTHSQCYCPAPPQCIPVMDHQMLPMSGAVRVSDMQFYAAAGVIKNARLVSGCMHRFCAECIEKWLRVCRHVHPQDTILCLLNCCLSYMTAHKCIQLIAAFCILNPCPAHLSISQQLWNMTAATCLMLLFLLTTYLTYLVIVSQGVISVCILSGIALSGVL